MAKTMIKPAVKTESKEKLKEKQNNSTRRHSAILELLDKNGDGVIDNNEQPWNTTPNGFCDWAKVLFAFSWLTKFQNSPVVGNAAEQSAAIKESLNTIGLVTALIITITVPICVNPSDVTFETKAGLWGADIQVFNEQWTIILYYMGLCISVALHIVSICAVVFSIMSLSCLSDDILSIYIEKVGSMILLVPVATFIVGCLSAVLSVLIMCFYTFGLYLTLLIIFTFFALIVIILFPFVYQVVKPLYNVPEQAMKEIEIEHNTMTEVTVDNVIKWLREITKAKKDNFTTNFKIETVVEVFKTEGISGLALPAVNNEFLREKCKLNWGDAYILMKEIKLRKGHVIHWRELKDKSEVKV
jgi:hypothetical protein